MDGCQVANVGRPQDAKPYISTLGERFCWPAEANAVGGLEKQKPILRQRGPRCCQWCPSNSTGRSLHAEPLTSRGAELPSAVPQTRAAPPSPASVLVEGLSLRPLLVFCRVFYKVKSRSAHMKSHAEQEKKAAALRQKEAEERAAARAAAEAAAILAARQQNGTRQMSGDSTNDDSSDGEDEEDEDWQ